MPETQESIRRRRAFNQGATGGFFVGCVCGIPVALGLLWLFSHLIFAWH